MARAHVGPARTTTAPVQRDGIGGWLVAAIVAILLGIMAYVVVAGGGTRYNPPAATPAPASAAPATAPGVAPQVTSAPAPAGPRYP